MALLLEQHADASMCCKTLNLLIDHPPQGLFSCNVLFSPAKSESRFENDMNCFSKDGSVPHTLLEFLSFFLFFFFAVNATNKREQPLATRVNIVDILFTFLALDLFSIRNACLVRLFKDTES